MSENDNFSGSERRERALELEAVRRKLLNSADGHVFNAARIVDGREDERLSDQDFAAFRGAVNAASSEIVLAERLRTQQQRHQKAAKRIDAKVIDEPKPYGKRSQNSWFLDRALVANQTVQIPGLTEGRFGDVSPGAAEERLRRHAVDVRHAFLKQDRKARRIERMVHEHHRREDPVDHKQVVQRELKRIATGGMELRTLTTGGGSTAAASGSAAAFVPPAFIMSQWAPYRGAARTFADQCGSAPAPEYGMQVYVPYFSGGTSASQQVEGSGVSDTTPTTALQNGVLQTISGEVSITQQILDRGFQGGGSFDQVMAKQLAQQVAESLNKYVLTTVTTGGATVAGASSWAPATQGIGPFFADLAKGREQLTDTAGTRLRPTHFFSTGDFYSYVSRQVDASTFRGWMLPVFAPGFPIASGADDGLQGDQDRPKWSRFTGTVLPGGVLWFTDDLIPASGSNTQLIVSAPEEAVVLVETDPVLSVFPETFAPNLAALVTLRCYASAVLRHASGSATISGNAYPASLL
jgi:hypothetical protein